MGPLYTQGPECIVKQYAKYCLLVLNILAIYPITSYMSSPLLHYEFDVWYNHLLDKQFRIMEDVIFSSSLCICNSTLVCVCTDLEFLGLSLLHIASFPVPLSFPSLAVWKSVESLVSFLMWAWRNRKMGKISEQTGCISHISQLTTRSTLGVYDNCPPIARYVQ